MSKRASDIGLWHLKCPICKGKVIKRCGCLKGESLCENGHEFHLLVRFVKINVVEIEFHKGKANHFSTTCGNCEVLNIEEQADALEAPT